MLVAYAALGGAVLIHPQGTVTFASLAFSGGAP